MGLHDSCHFGHIDGSTGVRRRLTLYLRADCGPPRRPRSSACTILYSILLAVGFVLALPWFLWKGRRRGKYLRTFRERMGRLPVYLNVDGDRSIWIHAVSVGEVLAARPLVPALRERFPGHRVFLSTTTMTGNAVAKKSVRGVDGLFYAPFDLPAPGAAGPRRRSTRRCSCSSRPRCGPTSSTRRAAAARASRSSTGASRPRSFPRYRRVAPLPPRACSRRGRPLPDAGRGPRRAHPRAGRARRARAGDRQPEVRRGRARPAPGAARPPAPGRRTRAAAAVGGGQHRRRRRGAGARAPSTASASACRRRACSSPRATRSGSPPCPRSSRPRASAACAAAPSTPGPGGTARCCCSTPSASSPRSTRSPTSSSWAAASCPPAATTSSSRRSPARPWSSGPHMENFQEIADQFRAESALVQVRLRGRARAARCRRSSSTRRAVAASGERARRARGAQPRRRAAARSTRSPRLLA